MTLATNRAPGDPGIVTDLNAAYALINGLTDGTGWRDISSLLVAGVASLGAGGFIRARRVGDRVTVRWLNLVITGSGAVNFLANLPIGWRVAQNERRYPFGNSTPITLGTNGQIGTTAPVTSSAGSADMIEWIASGTIAQAIANATGLPAA